MIFACKHKETYWAINDIARNKVCLRCGKILVAQMKKWDYITDPCEWFIPAWPKFKMYMRYGVARVFYGINPDTR